MSNFHIVTHTIRTQHSRDRFAGAEPGRENELRLHVKQYIPKSNPSPQPGDVTIIGAVANSFPKETLEPLWDDFEERLRQRRRRIRAIWIADPVNQGESGVLNEEIVGPDPSWFDHGRDLLFMINQFQDSMPHPIIGIGHSMGACHLTHLSLLHPRLLHSLVLLDTVFSPQPAGHQWAAASMNRRDLWPSRVVAADKMRANPAFKSWDPRVLDKYIEYGLRDLPTELHPSLPRDSNPNDPPVTLQTTKSQEQYNYLRAAYHDPRLLQRSENLWQDFETNERGGPFNRAEKHYFVRNLPHIKPAVLYIVGDQSEMSTPEMRKYRLERTGVGPGGSGGRVAEVVLDCGHLVPFEKTKEAALAAADFVDQELKRWDDEELERKEIRGKLSRREWVDVNEKWIEATGAKRRQPGKGKTKPPTKL